MARKLPAKTSFKLKTSVKKMLEALEKYNTTREEALQKHGKKNAEGELEMAGDGNVQFSQDGMRAFINEMTELNNLDVEIPTLSIDELDGVVDLSVDDLILLDGLIV
jgi:hypothetical protein